MSSGPTSPKRGLRSSLKSFFEKRLRSPTSPTHPEPGIDGSSPTGNRHGQSESQNPNSSKPASPIAPSYTTDNRRNTSPHAFEGTLRALHQSAELFPPLQAAFGTLISGLEAIPVAEDHRRSYDSLLAELKTLHEGIDKHRDLIGLTGMSDGMAKIILSIEAEARLLKAKRDQGRMSQILAANQDEDDLSQCYRRIEALSRQLQTNIGFGTWSVAYEQLMNTRLGGLSPALLAGYNSKLAAEINRRMCTENTRVAVLNALDSWANNPSAANVYWMSGMAGTGKTTIATTLSDALFKRKQLGASFFCTRSSPECSAIEKIVPTLAYQLARYSRPFQAALGRVLDNDPDIATREISLQFERLLKAPLLEVQNTIPSNTVIIIDALDECKDHGGVTTLLNALFQRSTILPVKFFLTSRPEPDIREEVLQQQEGKRDIFYLHDIEQSLVQADIEVYLREELTFMSPAEYQIKQLVQLADNLFIYAATVVRYIRPRKKLADPQSRLELVLSVKASSKKRYAELDTLYTTILNAALDEDVLEPIEMEHARHVLWASVCAREPMSIETLAYMVELTQEGVLALLQPFLSVLNLYEKEKRVSILHASFPDFIFDSERSGPHFCNQRIFEQRLSARCFAIMKTQLRFNICGLESSFLPDASVADIEQRIHTFISPSLSYAARYWGDHLSHTIPSSPVVTEIEEFFAYRLLFWTEVLNLTKSMITGIMELQSTRLWLLQDTNKEAAKALTLVQDAQDFVTSFSATSISLSTPHIYISALPFCPGSSTVFQNYRARMRGLVNPKGALFNTHGSALLAVRRMPDSVACMTSSRDGTLLAIGHRTGVISILNQKDGTPLKSFEGHGQSVDCIAFSPDNMQFVSGSLDLTIRCWARNGSLVLGPLVGHTDRINSVVFSPDGKHITSGGRDCIIRLWDARTGSLITSSSMSIDYDDRIITSVAFTPDGAHIISGLDSGAIYIRDVQNSTVSAISNPHSSAINFLTFALDGGFVISISFQASISLWSTIDWSPVTRTFDDADDFSGVSGAAVSPDGRCVAYSSTSGDIRLWNIADGTIVAGPLEGPMGPLLGQSLAFSADGTRLFSAAHDGTLCMWNIQKGIPINTSRRDGGHTAAINQVAFSSDGAQLFSCADDATVRIWSVDGGASAASFELQADDQQDVTTFTFSHDRSLVAASSQDQSIFVWDLEEQKHLVTFSNAHANYIYSLSFSPDAKLLASGSADCTVCIWDIRKGVLLIEPLREHTDIVQAVQFSPSGYHVVSCSSDQTICIWDTTSGQLISRPLNGNDSSVLSVSYSRDGRYIVAGDDGGKFYVWDVMDSRTPELLIAGPCAEEVDAISSVAFSPNGSLIATGSDDGAVNVWDAQTGLLIAGPFRDHSEEVNAVAWSPDGNIIASCSGDQTIRLINLQASSSLPSWGGNWNGRDDGWVQNQDMMLFWISPDLHRVLPTPYNSLVIGPHGPAVIEYEGLLVGGNWAQCYTSSE